MTDWIRVPLALVCIALAPAALVAQSRTDLDTDGGPVGTGSVAGDTGLWFVSSAEVLPAGAMAAGLARTDDARNQGTAEVTSVSASLARGFADQVEVFGAWQMTTWVDDVRGRGDVLAGAKVAVLSQRTGAPFALAVRGVLKLPTGNADRGISSGRTDLLAELVASRRLGRAEISGSGGLVRRGDSADRRWPDGLRSGAGLSVHAARSLRLFGEIHGEVYFDEPVGVRLVSAFDTPRTAVAGASWGFAPGLSLTGAVSHSVGVPDDRAGVGVGLRLGYQPGRRRTPPVMLVASAPPAAVRPPSHPTAGGAARASTAAGPGESRDPEFDDILFEYDRDTLRPAAMGVLDRAVTALRGNPALRLRLEGHACEIGTPEYNLALGERRARMVRDYLVSRGIAASRLEAVSFGEERPKHDNRFEEARALNRRTELLVTAR